MKGPCKKIQEQLADGGAPLLEENDEVREHVEGCADCKAFFEALQDVDACLAEASTHDAPDELVAATLEKVRSTPVGEAVSVLPATPASRRAFWRWTTWKDDLYIAAPALAASLFVLIVVGSVRMSRMGFDRVAMGGLFAAKEAASAPADIALLESSQEPGKNASFEDAFGDRQILAGGYHYSAPSKTAGAKVQTKDEAGAGGALSIDKYVPPQAPPLDADGHGVGSYSQMPQQSRVDSNERFRQNREGRPVGGATQRFDNDVWYSTGQFTQWPEPTTDYRGRPESPKPAAPQAEPPEEQVAGEDDEGQVFYRRFAPQDSEFRQVESKKAEAAKRGKILRELAKADLKQEERAVSEREEDPSFGMAGEEARVIADLDRLETRETSIRSTVDSDTITRVPLRKNRVQDVIELMPGISGRREPESQDTSVMGGTPHQVRYGPEGVNFTDELAGSPASAFLYDRDNSDGLTYQSPTGYWANTYVPGDPEMRLLEARLQARGQGAFQRADGTPLRLEEAAETYRQAFDPPDDSALALYLHSDKITVDGPTRMLVQVGLQASHRQSGRRPSMNVGLVLDLRAGPDVETASRIRALVQGFAAARQAGDRFSLTVAGYPGGMMVQPGDFRYGPVTVALQNLFGGEDVREVPVLSLAEAMDVAIDTVKAEDDPTAPLGASSVVLVTPSQLGRLAEPLAAMAHRSAVDGVPVSVIGIGNAVRLPELDRLALAGQGNRRLLTSPEDAAALAQKELLSAGRAVARAVRLRIGLAPGVKLVDILGSHPLVEEQAQQVRRAEVSIDQRLSRNLGIQADRGEDEAGIQIVIPSFYAGDSHVFLLDVVVERPGDIADVTVRYKDLVYLRNAVARSNLSISGRPGAPGPLERAVLKNLVAVEISEAIREAGLALERGNVQLAQERLTWSARLLEGLMAAVEDWRNDPELLNDISMIREYIALLEAGAGGVEAQRLHLSDSLQSAAWRKVMDRTEEP